MKTTKLASYGIATAWLFVAGVNPLLATDRHVPAQYPTIQAAVNAAASGDTIYIAPSVYVEQTWITNKNLTLVGQPGTILRACSGMAPGIPGVVRERSVIFIGNASVVTLKDLCFEGDQLGGENTYAMLGVTFDTAGGSVENCRFTGFRERTPGSVGGAAIRFWNGGNGATRYVANVSGTTITDCYTGVRIQGADDVISYDVTVVDNTITGVGLTTASDPLQGIHTKDGTTGLVARNTVSGFAHDGPVGPELHPIPFGILRLSRNDMPLPPMTFEDNVLRDNQVHLAFFKSDNSIVRNNTFEGNFPLIEDAGSLTPILQAAAGLWFSGADVQVIGNQFSDLVQGIRLAALGDDFLGNATNARLSDNRVCSVATNIVAETGASYTEQGTLTCPFPAPALSILSWPGIEEGFSVQSAPAPSGPWTTFNATPIRQNGQNRVVVPSAADQQFFRLAKP
jgi:hypothetical protein